MYVCICMCVCVLNILILYSKCISIQVWHISDWFIKTCVSRRACSCLCTYVYVGVCVYVSKMSLCVRVCVSLCVRVCVSRIANTYQCNVFYNVCACVYICTSPRAFYYYISFLASLQGLDSSVQQVAGKWISAF